MYLVSHIEIVSPIAEVSVALTWRSRYSFFKLSRPVAEALEFGTSILSRRAASGMDSRL